MNLAPLPITYQATVLEEHLDEMEHMNVMWYTHFFDRGTFHFFEKVGMNLDYFETRQAGAFALEQHTRYLVEVRLGQSLTVFTRAVGRSANRFHFMHFMTKDNTGVLVATTEIVGIHIDRTVRRSAPLPAEIAATFDRYLAEHRQLDWVPPVCGAMGL